MRIAWMTLVPMLLAPLSAAGLDCAQWKRLGGDQRVTSVQQMIEGHVFSKKGSKYTSENRIAMKRCLDGYLPRILDDFDDTCLGGRSAGMNALDEIFDRYFLSCVQ